MLSYRSIDYIQDVEAVVALLCRNLDPSFTLEFFKWKHLENPFGRSYGLLALDGDKIVGVRMFMFWKFYINGDIIKAIRPVDTVTDLDYRGKGIFSKLAIDGLKNNFENYDFVFNTPNEKSLPGNLKMGWKQLNSVNKFQIGITNPFAKSLMFKKASPKDLTLDGPFDRSFSSTLCTQEFLEWRYRDIEYKIACFENPDHYLIYKRSKIKGIPAIIVYEILGSAELVGQMLNSLGKKHAIPFIYFYHKGLQKNHFLKMIHRNKPVVVVKNTNIDLEQSLNLSLGDLEAKI